MKIVGYLKKKSNWSVSFKDNGTPYSVPWGEQRKSVRVPIFVERLRYKSYYRGQSSLSITLVGDPSDSLVRILQGDGEIEYTCSLAPFMEIFEGLTRGEFNIEEDGWFSGTFTFKKTGSALSITPFRGNLEDEVPIDED